MPIERKGNHFVVEIKVDKKKEEEKEKDGYIVPKKVATRRWNSKGMDVDEGKTQLRNRYGALTVEDEEAYEEYMVCQPCGKNSSVFAGQGWSI